MYSWYVVICHRRTTNAQIRPDSAKPILGTSKNLRLQLVAVAKQAGFSLT